MCSGFGIRSLGVDRRLLCWCRGVGGALLALRGRLCRGRAGRFGGGILLPWLLVLGVDWGCRRVVGKGRERKRELASYRWSRRCLPISGEWRGHAGSGGPPGYCTIVRCVPLNIGLHYMI